MSARVSVTVGSDGVLAVKTATTPEELANLGGEAARLRQAAHPGVVRLVEHRMANDTAELYTQYAGESLVTWRGTVPQAAGLLAAVASTVADLHDLGLVHGGLDETHVLLGADNRPRLCGFSPPPRDASPQDDVAALGRLFAVLLDRASASDRRGAFRWPRAQVAERRALAQLITDTADPVLSRRPTAKAFARSILATVRDAVLAPSGLPVEATAYRPDPNRPRHLVAPAAPLDAAAPDLDLGIAPVDVDVQVDEIDGPLLLGEAPDAVFGDQTTAEVEEIFVDRPWQEEDTHTVAPPARRRVQRPQASRRRAARVLTFTLLLVLVAVAAGLSVRFGSRDDAGAPGSPVSSSRTNGRSCAPAPPPSADTDGDGCGETVEVAAGRIVVDGAAFIVGDPDDAVAVGDWDCDGWATPAAYRPSTGDVFVFTQWAAEGHPYTVEPVAQVAGGRSLVVAPSTTSDSAGCDTLAVELADGEQRVVEVG